MQIIQNNANACVHDVHVHDMNTGISKNGLVSVAYVFCNG